MRFIAMTSLIGTLLLSGCGAPADSAGDEASLFSAPAPTLSSKETTVCDSLAKRTEAPSTSNLTLNLDSCKDAGLAAQDYKTATSFSFTDLPVTTATAATTDAVHKAIRAQLWLGRDFLSLAASLTGMMNKNKGVTGVINLPDSATKALANLAKPTITVTSAPDLDIANIHFGMAVNLKVTGVIKVNQDLQINGKLLDDAFAVTVRTTKDQTYDQSLIKSLQAVVIIIPYANDVYMDMYVDLTMFTTGVQAIVDNQLNTFLSTALKGAIDSVMAL